MLAFSCFSWLTVHYSKCPMTLPHAVFISLNLKPCLRHHTCRHCNECMLLLCQDIDRITKEVINQHSLSSYTPSKPMPHKDKATAAGSAVETPLAIRLQAASISAADTTAQSPCRPGSAAVTSDETASQDSHGRPSYSSQSMPHLQSPSQQVTAPDSQQPSSRNSISNEAEADTPHAAADSLHSASLHASSHDTTHAQSPSNMSDRPQAATPAAAATSQAHSSEHVAKGAAGREPGSAVEPKPLTVPSVSIQGWDDSPVTVCAIMVHGKTAGLQH